MNTTSKAGIKYSSILLVFFLFLLFPAYFFIYPGSGPAASGDIALHLARQYGFVFGKDIDSLYGPLGILRSRLPIAVSLTFYLLFDAYFLVTAFMVIRNILREHFHYGVIVFIFLAISINMTAALNDWFFFFLLFYVFSFLRTPEKSGYLLQGSILAVIGLYFRLDTGLFGALLFLAVVTYSLIRKKLTLGGFCRWILFFLVAVLVAGWILHVNLPGYIGTGIHLLSDYGEARFQAGPEKGKLLFHLAMEMMVCLFYWIGCLVILAVTRRDGKKADEIFVCLAVMAAAFIYFKSCFVRADDGQVFRFFAIMSLLIAFFYLNGPEDVWRRVPILGCWIVLGLSTLAVNLDKSQSKPPVLRLIDLSFIPGRFRAIGTYFSGIWRYRSVSATLGQNGPEPVDTALKAAIGNASTDIVPWNVSRIWSNGLRYDPRPTIQSFYAFNSWLDSLNYEKYMSPGAPRYVLLSFARVDGHFPFFDEARTKLALLSQYDAVTELGGELLLKNADRRRLQPAGEETVTVKLNSDIPIKRQDSLLQFSRFYLHYDCTGKTGRWLDHPPGLKITLTLNDGSSFTYRISKSVLEDGVIVNKYVDEEEELQLLMQARGRLTPNIAKINIDSDSTGVGFVDSVTMVNAWYAFREPTMEERAADSSGIARLYDRSRPELFPVDSLAPGSFPYQLDEFNTFSQFIRVNVSLPRLRGLAAPPLVRPVLRSRDHFFRLPEFKQSGPELISVAAKDLLPPGDYELGLAKEKDSGGKKWIVSYTGRHLFIRSDYKITESGPLVPNSEGNVDMKYNIDRAFIWKGQVLIEGWALMQKKDTGKTTTTIVLSSPGRTYRLTTDPQERSDVGGPGSYCGFSVKIPESRLVRDKYIIAIEQTCCNGRFHNLQYSSRILKPGMDNDVQLPLPAPVLPATTNYLSGIDRFDDEKEFMTIEGWAIGAMDQVQDSRIYIILRSDSAAFVYRTVMEKRTDLTAHYHNGFNLDNCGFSAKMSKEMLPPGKYTVGLWVRPDDGPGWVKYLSLYSVKDAN